MRKLLLLHLACTIAVLLICLFLYLVTRPDAARFKDALIFTAQIQTDREFSKDELNTKAQDTFLTIKSLWTASINAHDFYFWLTLYSIFNLAIAIMIFGNSRGAKQAKATDAGDGD